MGASPSDPDHRWLTPFGSYPGQYADLSIERAANDNVALCESLESQ